MNDIKDQIERERHLFDYAGDDRVITSQEMQAEIKNWNKPEIELKVLFPDLDGSLGGFRPGELITVTGLTGEGKTTLCQSFTRNLSRQSIGCIWFSYEVLPKYFLEVFGDPPPVFYMPRKLAGNTITWIESRILEAKLKYDCRVVFCDHLHFLIDMRTHHNMSLEIGFVMRSLKKIAIAHQVCIFLIAHLGKIKPNENAEPDLSDIRDSSFVSQESDSVLIIWRRGDDSVNSMLKIAKNRKRGIRKKIELEKVENFLYEKKDLETTYE